MPQDDDIDDTIDDADAEKLLEGDDADDGDGKPVEKRTTDRDDDDGDASALRDPGKKALDAMKRERNAARKALADAQAELKKIADKDKSESERLQEARDEAASRAAKAEERARALSIAMERAPAHATLAQVRAVAKRVRGESDDDLEQDADELFELLAPAPPEKEKPADRKVAGRPRERLRGGGDPDDEPEENDPRKLAELIRRR